MQQRHALSTTALHLALAGLLAFSLVLPVAAQEETDQSPPAVVEVDEGHDGAVAAEVAEAPGDAAEVLELIEGPAESVTVSENGGDAQAIAATEQSSLSQMEVTDRVLPSVVRLLTATGGASGVQVAEGVLTNEHVIRGFGVAELVAVDGRRGQGAVERCSASLDLALLSTDLVLPALGLESARAQRLGDRVLVVGYPLSDVLGSEATITSGIVSAVREDGPRTVLQTDAAMNPGNSGGAIVNGRGKLVALATFGVRGGEGLNFGVAAESIQAFLDRPPTRCSTSSPTPTATRAPATPTPSAGDVILSDNFSSETQGVLPRSSSSPADVLAGYTAGEYQIQVLRPAGAGGNNGEDVEIPGRYANSSLAIEVRLLTQKEGLVFLGCRLDAGSGYGALVAPEAGRFALLRLDHGKAVTLIPPQRSIAIRSGQSTNALELSCAGSTISLRANGTTLATVQDHGYRNGQLAFGYYDAVGGEARFDNLVVSQR